MRGMTTRKRWTPPSVSATRNLKSFAALVEFHGQQFKQALAEGNADKADRNAAHLYHQAMQAAWAGNMILNNGRPVAEVIRQIEAEMAARRKEQEAQ